MPLKCSFPWQKRVENKKDSGAHTQLAARNIKPLSLQPKSEGSSFNNDSVGCKETGRKEETERQSGVEGGYDQANKIKMLRKIQQVLQSLESLADLRKAVYCLLSRCVCVCVCVCVCLCVCVCV